RILRTLCSSFAMGEARRRASKPAPACFAAKCSAASMPDRIAWWVPLIFGTFIRPAASPMRIAPGISVFGSDCRPPSISARAPPETICPPSSSGSMRVVLQLLERLPRPEQRVGIIKPRDEADRDAILVELIDEAAAVGLVVQRPAERVHDVAGLHAPRRQLPEFLEADAIGLRIAVFGQPVFFDQCFADAAAATFGQHREFRQDVDALRIAGLVR